MKLKYYIVIGYLISMLITVAGVFFGLNHMLIETRGVYYILSVTIIACIVGGIVNLFLLSSVFTSLKKLKQKMKDISQRCFDTKAQICSPQEFKDLETAFNQMSSELESTFKSLNESEREKTMMIAQLSHDIKTPITSIQSTVEGILDGIISEEEVNYYLNTISRQTNRLNHLVEELSFITLETMSDTAEPYKEETIYLDKLLIDILSEFQLVFEKENRQVMIDVAPDVSKLSSQYDKLSRILLNLISNAVKYSDPGSPLTIKAYSNRQDIVIDIIDQGYGIKDEDLASIFNRLYRVESSRNMKTGGHGLGLYIARQLAHQLNGDILVESQYQKGSKFSLVLKLQK
ncbi:TPA: ATP-binding protein [Streptococcus agalactiae]